MQTAISIRNLSMTFGSFLALKDLSLDVAPGEFVTLLGPSGCGKTTLLKLLSGFLSPTCGTIAINGQDVTRMPPERRDTALCFQSYALFPHLTVRKNLEFGLRQKRLAPATRDQRVAEVSEKLGLGPQMDKLPNQLSGGQQQRVSLGRALVMRPGVILFDEPLSNLDARLRDQVRFEIRRIQKDYGLTAIYVTHDQAEALAMSDRVMVLNRGKAEQIDTPEGLYEHPRTAFVAEFIGGANVFRGRLESEPGTGRASVATPIGRFPLPDGTKVPAGEIEIAWRPERATLTSPMPEAIKARVLHRAYQGSFTELLVETEGTTFRVVTTRNAPAEGSEIHLTVAPSDVILLEPRP